MEPRIKLGTRVIDRNEAQTCVTVGWRSVIDRVYDLIEATPGVDVCWVSQRQGLLWIECMPRPLPAHVLWRLAAVERLSGRVCQVCASPGRLCVPTEPMHWLLDEARVLCPYCTYCWRAGVPVEQLLDERLAVFTHAPHEMRPLLLDDVATLSPADYRTQLVWASETVPAVNGDGFVVHRRISWVLGNASAEQLGACEPTDLEGFFLWDESPEVKEAALAALARLTRTPGERER
jgi:hypothetical protein